MKNNKINIITSFPKSGNTWMRFIIYDLLFNDQNATIENSSEINRLIPDFHMSKNNQLILDSELMCEAKVLCGCVSLNAKKPVALPSELRSKMVNKKDAG